MKLAEFRRLNDAAAEAVSLSLARMTGLPLTVKLAAAAPAADARPSFELDPYEMGAGVILPVTGKVDGAALLWFPEEVALLITRHLMPASQHETELRPGPIDDSAMREVANIICGNYLTVVANALHTKIMPGLPTLACGTLGSILEHFFKRFSPGPRQVIKVDIEISLSGTVVAGHMLLRLNPNKLAVV